MIRDVPGKRFDHLDLPHVLQLPVFLGARSLEIEWCSYAHVACIIHHGDQLNTGHFTALVRGGQTYSALDDDKACTDANPAVLAYASQNMYVMLPIREDLVAAYLQCPTQADTESESAEVPASSSDDGRHRRRSHSAPTAHHATWHLRARDSSQHDAAAGTWNAKSTAIHDSIASLEMCSSAMMNHTDAAELCTTSTLEVTLPHVYILDTLDD